MNRDKKMKALGQSGDGTKAHNRDGIIGHCRFRNDNKWRAVVQAPRITTVQEKVIRDYRCDWEDYFNATGERQALAVIECLTCALIQGGAHP